ncbi:MAG: diacylglycerol kinase family lipid kinase [Asgard group archaeon]|nr:diacylglycerol kinase family lipid kinase [Asgard group archaeon]
MKIICNPATFGGKALKRWPDVLKELKEAGLDFEVEWTKGVNDAIRITKESIEDHDIIVSYGGDGTINEIVTAIGQTDFKTTLGIIPAGRGNDNAFSLRQTDKINDIVDMLTKKQVRSIDCMKVDDGKRYCFGVAGAGIDAYIAEKVIGKSTRMSYNIALMAAFFSYRPRHMTVDIDDGKEIRDLKALSVMIGNGQRVGNKKMVAPNAIIDDGLLDVVIIGNTGVFEALITSSKLGKGTHITHPKVEVIRGKKVVLTSQSQKPILAHTMGELIGTLPHTFECLHRKLKVLRMSDEILIREGWNNANVFLDNASE